ncbi:hypothetical protein BC941DRAFT_452710 [Chlamydoabsidia padenii]|nr:hypothetical protein BC941DRAFT_452710 [Chlamydoabsidia padenii]
MFMGTLLFVFLYCYLASMFVVTCGDIVSCSTPGSASEWVVLVKRDVCVDLPILGLVAFATSYGAPFGSWGWIMMYNVYGYFIRLGLAFLPWQDVGDIVSCSTPGSAGEWVVLVKRDVCIIVDLPILGHVALATSYGAPFDSWGWIMVYNAYGCFMALASC